MTSLSFTPDPDYKILIPKTIITTGTGNLTVDLSQYVYKALRIELALKDSAHAGGVAGWGLAPGQSGTNVITTEVADLPNNPSGVLAGLTNNSGTTVNLGLSMGTTAPAAVLEHYEVDIYNCDLTSDRYGFVRRVGFAPTIASSDMKVGGWIDTSAIAYDGFRLITGSALTVANCWYRVTRLN